MSSDAMSADVNSKLPIPFFRVLEEEHAHLRGSIALENCWDFDEGQFEDASVAVLDPAQDAAGAIERLARERSNAAPALSSRREIADEINALIHGKCLYQYDAFPKCGLPKELKRLVAAASGHEDDRLHLNRLLIEFICAGHVRRIYDVNTAKIYAKLHQREGRAALCLSGGGIRSATFALGVLQGLAKHRLLGHFDYLSTVSGGGYIGSWLSSWIHHAKDQEAVFQQLAHRERESPLEPEPKELRHLRAYSNYLTPKLGLLSADTWVLAGTYLRNLFLNWLVFVPLLLALLAIPRLCVAVLGSPAPSWLMGASFWAGVACFVVAFAYSAMHRPGVEEHLKASPFWFARRRQSHFLLWCLLPMWLGVVCLTMFWGWLQNPENSYTSRLISGIPGQGAPLPMDYVALGTGLHFFGWLLAEVALRFRMKGTTHRMKRVGELLKEAAAVAGTGALGGLLLWVVADRAYQNYQRVPNTELYVCFAAPVMLMILLVTASVFIGISSGRTSDEDREWWARMGAWILIAIGAWTVFSFVILFGPLLFFEFPKIVAAVGGLSGVFTLIVGHSGLTAANKKQEKGAGLPGLLLNKALGLAAPLAALCIVALLSLGTSGVIFELSRIDSVGKMLPDIANLPFHRGSLLQIVHYSPLWLVLGFMVLMFGAAYAFSASINVNKFSLHSVYRNRLIRAYLGASNPQRAPNPFTGFDPRDNVRMSELTAPCGRDGKIQTPIHVVNMALNLVGGDNLAWQQRKAETFTASALHCGNVRIGYRRSSEYARSSSGQGLSLGTAVTISGAAASPNMGYHSSPVVAALMTLFNVRLGWWLGNPGPAGQKTFGNSAPKPAAWHVIKEALGLTTGKSPYVYLSDGGHFENLGLYEMVLRRCKVIVVSDAGCDPKCSLDDLGNAIRKIRIDLGIRINIQKFGIYSRNDAAGKSVGKYCAIGEIDYAGVDKAGDGDDRKGILIYVKPAICGDEPKDVFNYLTANEQFPHEPTSDQWFSESQFESYRMLGFHVADSICRSRAELPPASGNGRNLGDLVTVAYRYVEVEVPAGFRTRFEASATASAETGVCG